MTKRTRAAIVLTFAFYCIAVTLTGQTPPTDNRQAVLDGAINRLWIVGDASGSVADLTRLADGPRDELSARALFHLGCAELLTGNPEAARRRLAALGTFTNVADAASQARRLAQLLDPQGEAATADNAKVSLDFKDVRVADIIRMIAEKTNTPVIIDRHVRDDKVTVRMLDVNAKKALKLLAESSGLKLETVDGVLMVSSAFGRRSITERSEGRIDVDFRDIELTEALQLLATRAGLNLVPHRYVKGVLTLRLEDIAPATALQMLGKMYDLHLERDGNCMIVMFRKDADTVLGRSTRATVRLKYLSGRDALTALTKANVGGAELASGSAANEIILAGDPDMVARGRTVLDDLDKPQDAIMISAWIWELASGTQLDADAFGKLSEDQKKATAKVLAAPRVMTLPGRDAEIKIGSETPGGGENSIRLWLVPIRLADGMIQLSTKGNINTLVVDNDGKKQQTREFQASFIIAPDQKLAQDLKGQGSPIIIEYAVKNTK